MSALQATVSKVITIGSAGKSDFKTVPSHVSISSPEDRLASGSDSDLAVVGKLQQMNGSEHIRNANESPQHQSVAHNFGMVHAGKWAA